MKGEGSRKGSFFKQAKKSYPMFPAPEERIKWDEYGEIIKYVSETSFLASRLEVVTVLSFEFNEFGPSGHHVVSEYLSLKDTENF